MECGKKWFVMDFAKDRYIEEALPQKCAYFGQKGLEKTFRAKWIKKYPAGYVWRREFPCL